MSVPILKIPIQTSDRKPFIKEGDTILEYSITVSSDFNMTDVDVDCELYDSDGRLKLSLSSTSGGITVNGQVITFDKIIENNLFSGVYKGDVKFKLPTGEIWRAFNIEYKIVKQYTL